MGREGMGKNMDKLSPSASIVILTGAGISKESGLDTFRDADGIWSKVRIEDVATPDAFRRDPARVHGFYNGRRSSLVGDNIRPNAAHQALARLERDWPGSVLIVTQNVDNLHERGGTRNLIHMHGELLKSVCAGCGDIQECTRDLSVDDVCTSCGEAGGLRPNVVWFGEMPMMMDEIEAALVSADLFISIGTSGNVYPAAGFVELVRRYGHGHTLELNLEPSEGATLFQERRYGAAGEIVPAFVDELLSAV